ncbi:hypothetical protein [Clostridium sp. MD294]|uniref:hypothetical protein n=1 Tax=Clostridium sp. MD294 TaxID=97138 RepID=UPI0002C95BCE|nr:hypothetical protein [Clostridium sp. MD294]NDO46585.1 hypothetical protein [Clostridium sp. MD294]USF28984.1 hypothetical protein C820_000367 [Clostridium sp. MD294]
MLKLKQIFKTKYFIACISILLICCMFTFYIVFLWKNTETKTVSLPTLPVEDYATYSASEGYLAYDISEIYNGSPWKEEWDITTLPVFYNVDFKNSSNAENYEHKINIMKNKMKYLEEIAQNFGVTDNYTIKYGTEEGKLENKEISFQNYIYDNTILITFKKPIKLPFENTQQNKEQSEKIISYFIDNYKDCFGWKEAEKALHFDYSIEGKKYFLLYAYEKGNTLEQELLNYHFNNVCIITNEKNEITSALFKKTDLSDKIGEYAIITSEQAKQLLYSGKYTSTLSNTFSQNMTIVKTELVYRNTIYDSIYMPCYKFFVQLPHIEGDGLRHYDVYYIPAIKQQYLEYTNDIEYQFD